MPPELAGLPQYADARELGRGGMGVVYLARNTLLDRPEVLKVVGPAALARGGPGAAERFLREMRAAARLNSRYAVAAYAAYPVAGGGLVFAMEYAPGDDLAELVARDGPLSVADACRAARDAARGLADAHAAGLVHRDVKPANLIRTTADGRPVVKVLDFGLAKRPLLAGRSDLTRDQQVLGTPHYLAPEQIANAAAADIRADLYALGGTLFFLLTGEPPFAGAGSVVGVLAAHRGSPPPPLRGVPPGLAALVARLLAKDPADRPQTPAEVAAALDRFAEPRTHRGKWLAAGAGGAVAVAGGLLLAGRPAPTPATAPAPPTPAVVAPPEVPPPPRPVAAPPTTPAPLPPPASLPTAPPDDGFVSLFDGKTLAGWKKDGYPDSKDRWAVADGVLIGVNNPTTYSYLLTREEFADVAVRFEFRLGTDRSVAAVAVRATPGERAPMGIPGTKMNHPRVQFGRFRDPRQNGRPVFLDTLLAGRVPDAPPALSVGGWHAAEVVVHGDICTVAFDGTPALASVPDLPPGAASRFVPGLLRPGGRLGFLVTDGEVRFRNVRARRLDGTPPPPRPAPAAAPPEVARPDPPAVVTLIASRFEDGKPDGWTTRLMNKGVVEGKGFEVRAEPGNRWLFATGVPAREYWGWLAPRKFTGDQSDKFGRLLTYRLRADTPKPAPKRKDANVQRVRLSGGGLSVMLYDRADVKQPAGQWRGYAHRLDASGGWQLLFNRPASDDDLRTVLANLGEVWINMGHLSGDGTGGLDDVVLGADR